MTHVPVAINWDVGTAADADGSDKREGLCLQSRVRPCAGGGWAALTLSCGLGGSDLELWVGLY